MNIHVLTIFAQTNQQEKVLHAINESVSSTVDPLLLFGGLGGVVLVAVGVGVYQKYGRRWFGGSAAGAGSGPFGGRGRPSRRFLHSHRKLMNEIAREVGLSPAEVRKLRHHADRLNVQQPLTLLLCPSLLKKDGQNTDAL